jgi:hypothetical protein
MDLFQIPQLKRSPDGILALVLGILLGGLGILITGAIAKHRNTMIVGAIQLGIAILGIVLSFMMPLLAFVGFLTWVWAVVWGILIFVKSS